MSNCLVCEGTPGKYPIMNSTGKHLYNIDCPECDGSGEVYADDEYDQIAAGALQRAKYKIAMAEIRATPAASDQGSAGK